MKKHLTLENLLLIGMVAIVVALSVEYCGLQQRAARIDPYKELKDSVKAHGWPDNKIKVNPPDTLHPGGILDSGGIDLGTTSSTGPRFDTSMVIGGYGDLGYVDTTHIWPNIWKDARVDSLGAIHWPGREHIPIIADHDTFLWSKDYGNEFLSVPQWQRTEKWYTTDSFYGNADAIDDTTTLNHSKLIKRK